MQPRALMIPPGFPEFFGRVRTLDAGPVRLKGRAWSGFGPIQSVEVSHDGGRSWTHAALGGESDSPYAWRGWTFDWEATPGDHELLCRAADAAGNVQPLDQPWNHHGLSNNMAQRVAVTVR